MEKKQISKTVLLGWISVAVGALALVQKDMVPVEWGGLEV